MDHLDLVGRAGAEHEPIAHPDRPHPGRLHPGRLHPDRPHPDRPHPGRPHPACRGQAAPTAPSDRGSVTPLVLGMMVCLLLLCAGVTAATSAFLARQRLQSACDGAAAAAADAAANGYDGGAIGGPEQDSADAAARRYLAVRSPRVSVHAEVSPGSVTLACTAESAITLGALFATPTLSQTVRAVGHAVL